MGMVIGRPEDSAGGNPPPGGAVRPELSIHSILRTSLSVLRSHPWPFFVIAVTCKLPTIVFGPRQGAFDSKGLYPTLEEATLSFVLILALSIQSVVATGATAPGVHCWLAGKKASLADLARDSSAWLPSLMVLALAVSVVEVAGGMLCVVPGLVVGTIFYVSAPAAVVETLSPMRAMQRSIELSKGHRYTIFFLIVLLTLCSVVSTSAVQWLAARTGLARLVVIADLLAGIVWGALSAVTANVTFAELRNLHAASQSRVGAADHDAAPP